MSAASEGPGVVDQALARNRMQQGTGSVLALGQHTASCGFDGMRRDKGFAFGEVGSFSCETELAALRSERAVPRDRTLGKFSVNRPDPGGSGFLRVRDGVAPGHQRDRKFLRRFFPSVVRMDSGWNWTP